MSMTLQRSALWLWLGAALSVLTAAMVARGPIPVPPYLLSVLLHPLLGLVLYIPFLIWWWRRRRAPWMMLGGSLLLVAGATGGLLVALGNRRPILLAHEILALAGLLVLLAAVGGKPRRALWWWSAAGLALALVAVGWPAGREPEIFSQPPTPRSMAERAMGGAEGPFYPSAASTRDGGLLPASAFATAASCGRAGCHPDVVAQWESSAHRFSGLDNPWYRATFQHTRARLGPVQVRWCGGCHTPALLLSGQLDRPPTELEQSPAAHAGVSCLSCHGMTQVNSSIGQADYQIALPELHALTTSSGTLARVLHDLLLHLDPKLHRRAYGNPWLSGGYSPEACSTCHRGYVEEAMGADRFRIVFDDYEPWQDDAFSGQSVARALHAVTPQRCIDCHMPEVGTRDPGSRDGRIRSHRFAAANTALPTLHGDDEQLARVIEFLHGAELTLDLFALTEAGELGGEPNLRPVNVAEIVFAPLDRIPAVIRRGESRRLDIVVRARGVGHRFPGGKADLAECWLELVATDTTGRTLFHSGRAVPGSAVDPGAHHFAPWWIDADGRRIDRHNLWEARARVADHRLGPNTAQRVRFRLDIPADAGDRLTLTARIRYRPFSPAFNRWAFSVAESGEPPTLPIVTLAEHSLTLDLIAADAAVPEPTPAATAPEVDSRRWYDYGVSLSERSDHAGCRKAFQRAFELDPTFARAYLERVLVVQGLEEPRAMLDRALELDPELGRARFYNGLLLQAEGNSEAAVATLRALAGDWPRDQEVRRELGNLLFMARDFPGAIEQFRRLLDIDPLDADVHRSLIQAYQAQGDRERAQHHQALYERLRENEGEQELIRRLTESDPYARRELATSRELVSGPLDPLAGTTP